MNKNIFLLFLYTFCAFSCGGIAILESSSETNIGGFGGDSGSGEGVGGAPSTSSSFNWTSSSSESTTSSETNSETTTTTETFVCESGPKNCQEGTCFCPATHACCNAPVNFTMCSSNENGYCCSADFFCIQKVSGE